MIYTALLAYISGFDFKESIPIGTVIIFVQNSILLLYFLNKKHPKTRQNLIVFDNFLLLLPSIFSGNLIGYLFFVTLPKMIINICFGCTLCFFIYIVLKE